MEYNVEATSFMTYHTVLKTSEDYYRALDAALRISEYITMSMNSKLLEMGLDVQAEVIPYRYNITIMYIFVGSNIYLINRIFSWISSIFHVFYEQYLTFRTDAVQGLMISFLAILITSALLLGLDIWSAFLLFITILMTIVNITGSMYWWDIELNAISLVNIILVSKLNLCGIPVTKSLN